MGHARALLALDDPKTQIRIFNEIISQGYSVRKVEEIVKSLSSGESVESGGKRSLLKEPSCQKNTPCCKAIFAASSEQRYNCPAVQKVKAKLVSPSMTRLIWNESWKYSIH